MNAAAHRLLPTILGVCIILASGGCDNQHESGRIAALRQLKTLETEIETLKQINGTMEKEGVLLRAEIENLRVENHELRHWAALMARSFGPYVWFIGDSERPIPLKPVAAASPEVLIKELNTLFRDAALPLVALVKIENDIAFAAIPESDKLTQRMGSTGAAAYLNAVVYTLCSLPTITCVDFTFLPGDHAAPGRICP